MKSTIGQTTVVAGLIVSLSQVFREVPLPAVFLVGVLLMLFGALAVMESAEEKM